MHFKKPKLPTFGRGAIQALQTAQANPHLSALRSAFQTVLGPVAGTMAAQFLVKGVPDQVKALLPSLQGGGPSNPDTEAHKVMVLLYQLVTAYQEELIKLGHAGDNEAETGAAGGSDRADGDG